MEKETLDKVDIEEIFGKLDSWTKSPDITKLPELDRSEPVTVPVDDPELVGVRRSKLRKVRSRLGDVIKGDDDGGSGLPVRPRPAQA